MNRVILRAVAAMTGEGEIHSSAMSLRPKLITSSCA